MSSEEDMPERQTTEKAKQKLRHGRAPSTAAGEFVREEMHHIREGKRGARSTKQAIAIGLSKARRAGVPLKPPKRGSARTRKSAAREYAAGQRRRKPSRTRARAAMRALRREPHRAASHRKPRLRRGAQQREALRRVDRALATQAHRSALQRGHTARSAAARKAARTKRKAARTRARHA
jgi:uncharacterized protein DUF6496